MAKQVSIKVHCKYHPTAVLINEFYSGDLTCSTCGIVVVERAVDPSSEWRSFSDGHDGCRVGGIETEETDGQTTTTIQQGFNMKFLDENGESKFKNVAKVDRKELNLTSQKRDIAELCERLNIDKNTYKTAVSLLHQIIKSNFVMKRNKAALNCVCVFLACIDNEVPRTQREILKIYGNIEEKKFKKILRLIQIGFKRPHIEMNPNLYVSRFLYKLDIQDFKTEKLVNKVIENILKIEPLKMKASVVIAGSAIQFVCDIKKVKVDLASFIESIGYSKASVKAVTKILHNNSEKILSNIKQ